MQLEALRVGVRGNWKVEGLLTSPGCEVTSFSPLGGTSASRLGVEGSMSEGECSLRSSLVGLLGDGVNGRFPLVSRGPLKHL